MWWLDDIIAGESILPFRMDGSAEVDSFTMVFVVRRRIS